MENLALLIQELRKYSDELPWLEFKHNNYDPDMIGQDICALANGAALDEKTAPILYGEFMIKRMKLKVLNITYRVSKKAEKNLKTG